MNSAATRSGSAEVATRVSAVAPAGLTRPDRVAPACAMVIFGATGDLTHRKLIPALFNLWAQGLLSEHFRIMGVARRELSDEAFRATPMIRKCSESRPWAHK